MCTLSVNGLHPFDILPQSQALRCPYSTQLPRTGRRLELRWRTSREFHPFEALSKLRTGVSLWVGGVVARRFANTALTVVEFALHLILPSVDAVARTGGLGALGLSLCPPTNVLKLPDIHFSRFGLC